MVMQIRLRSIIWIRMNNPPLIKRLKPGLKVAETGNKAFSLLALHKYRFRIPFTYILPAEIHDRYLHNKESLLSELDTEIRKLPYRSWAVRSSAITEDTAEFTYAGQYQTFTNVTGPENLIRAISDVWDSSTTMKDSEYHKRTSLDSSACAVIIQEMVHSQLAGVSFSKNPVTNHPETVVEAIEGPGEDLVQKGLTPLRWRFRKSNLLEGDPGYRSFAVIKKVASDTQKLKVLFRNHVDIEWAFDGKHIYFLQFRHITVNRDLMIYSNKMAQEMLPGQIKPLVWSVNIPLVNGTWIALLSEITGRLDVKPEDLAKPFYYRTYFNIAALSRIFNEFGFSTEALENLMLGSSDSKPSFRPGLRTFRHTFRIIRFIKNKILFEKFFISEFSRLNAVYKETAHKLRAEFSFRSYPEYFSHLFREGQKLTYLNIVTPILMQIYNKRFKNKMKKIKLDYDLLDFHADFPELKRLSPMHSIKKIRDNINSLPEDVKRLCDTFEKLRVCPEAKEINDEFLDFLNLFGHFSESGTDFSVRKWEEGPEKVFDMIMKSDYSGDDSRLVAFEEMKKGKKGGLSLCRLYSKAGRFKVYREQISSLFIFGHGLFRTLFMNLGKELSGTGVIDSPEDIFYLYKNEIDEIFEKLNAGQTGADHRKIIEMRRNEMEATRDFVMPSVIYGETAPIVETEKIRNHKGVGTSPGTFSGTTKTITGLNDFSSVNRGDVLLIPFSDVSWTPMLVKAGAIVSETGGMLSHCSIIAREMGIPALVSVENACSIGTGLRVTVDGSNGILTIHDYE